MKEFLDKKSTYKVFGELVDLSDKRISQLIKKGVLTKGETVGEWLKKYIANLRDTKAGHGSSDIQQDAIKAKTRKDNLEADLKEIKIAETLGQLGDIETLEKGLASIAEQYFRSGHEAKEKILQGIKAEYDIDVSPELINEPINEHLSILEGADPRQFI